MERALSNSERIKRAEAVAYRRLTIKSQDLF